MSTLVFAACDCAFEVECRDDATAALLTAAFGGLLVSAASASLIAERYPIEWSPSEPHYILRDATGRIACRDDAEGLLFHLDKSFTIALQRRRPDLFFVHAAAIAFGDRAAMLIAPSGTGKSTLTLALMNGGATYLSDELAPVNVAGLTVHPYPHAICLKASPPMPYRLPSGTIETGERFHVPVDAFAGRIHHRPASLAALIFLRRRSTSSGTCRELGSETAAAHVVANTLNLLSHEGVGLDGAIRLAQSVPCYELDTWELGSACDMVEAVLRSGVPTR